MSKLKSVFIFSLGFAAGAAASWYYWKGESDRREQEVVDEMKKVYTFRRDEPAPVADISEDEETPDAPDMSQAERQEIAQSAVQKQDIASYAKALHDTGYAVNYNDLKGAGEAQKAKQPEKDPDIFVIAPEDFGENPEYKQVSLTYYAGDQVLADEDNTIIRDPEKIVGEDFESHFGEYEEDSVFVRNERLHCEYEILRDLRRYIDVESDDDPESAEDE